jgi:hypothetical protein
VQIRNSILLAAVTKWLGNSELGYCVALVSGPIPDSYAELMRLSFSPAKDGSCRWKGVRMPAVAFL